MSHVTGDARKRNDEAADDAGVAPEQAAVAAVLAAHELVAHRARRVCRCGWAGDDHHAHVAAALAANLPADDGLRAEWLEFTTRLGFGDGVTEPAATPCQIIENVEQAFGEAAEYREGPRICEPCGEWLATQVCEHCHGSGCGPGTASGAYEECEWCAGVGKVHPGCVEKSYADLAAQVALPADDGARAAIKAEAWNEVVRAVEAELDDADQVRDSLEKPNYIAVWGVRRVLMPFGGKPHRWPVPAARCAECEHYAPDHDPEGEDGCEWDDCDCLLSRSEAHWGRDEAMDDEITQATWEDAVATGEPWALDRADNLAADQHADEAGL